MEIPIWLDLQYLFMYLSWPTNKQLFQVTFDLFQAETFYHIKSYRISPWSKQLQVIQVQLQHSFLWLETLNGKVNWVAFLEKCCNKNFHPCICLPSERFMGVIIFEYGGTANFFFNGIKCFSMFRSLCKWNIFIGELSSCHKFCQSWRVLV